MSLSIQPFGSSGNTIWSASSNPSMASSKLTGLSKPTYDYFAHYDELDKLATVDEKLGYVQAKGTKGDDWIQATQELQSRLNITDTIRTTEDMIETIQSPEKKLRLVLEEIKLISTDMAVYWAKSYNEFVQLGDPPIVASARADQYVLPMLKERMKILKIRYPYSFRAEGALNELLLRSEKISQNGRFIVPKVAIGLPAIGQ